RHLSRVALPLADPHVLVRGAVELRHLGGVGAAGADLHRHTALHPRPLGARDLDHLSRRARLDVVARPASDVRMRRAWPLLALSAPAAGGCGQKGPLYLPDKGARVVTSAPATTAAQPAPPATPPATTTGAVTPPESAAPPAPAAPKPDEKDKTQDQDSQPPK